MVLAMDSTVNATKKKKAQKSHFSHKATFSATALNL